MTQFVPLQGDWSVPNFYSAAVSSETIMSLMHITLTLAATAGDIVATNARHTASS